MDPLIIVLRMCQEALLQYCVLNISSSGLVRNVRYSFELMQEHIETDKDNDTERDRDRQTETETDRQREYMYFIRDKFEDDLIYSGDLGMKLCQHNACMPIRHVLDMSEHVREGQHFDNSAKQNLDPPNHTQDRILQYIVTTPSLRPS